MILAQRSLAFDRRRLAGLPHMMNLIGSEERVLAVSVRDGRNRTVHTALAGGTSPWCPWWLFAVSPTTDDHWPLELIDRTSLIQDK